MAQAINYRIPRQRQSLVRDGSLQCAWKQFSNARDVYCFAREQLYSDADREQFHVLLLDGKNRLIGVNMVSQGSLSASVVHAREVFKAAILSNSAAVILMHNHPSGDPAPSREDRECTIRLNQAGNLLGIRVLDHVICGETDYFSFADAGLLQNRGRGSSDLRLISLATSIPLTLLSPRRELRLQRESSLQCPS